LKEAHDSGEHAWSKSRKRDYANSMSHPDHLIAVSSRANRSKSAKDPYEWMPPDRSHWRKYTLVLDPKGQQLLNWKHHDHSRLDSSAFKQDHDALYQQYSKTTTRRVLRVG